MKKENKKLKEKARKFLELAETESIRRTNIIVDFMEDIVRNSIKRGYTSMNNGILLEYLKDARKLANAKW